jgi:hypothetical protein
MRRQNGLSLFVKWIYVLSWQWGKCVIVITYSTYIYSISKVVRVISTFGPTYRIDGSVVPFRRSFQTQKNESSVVPDSDAIII